MKKTILLIFTIFVLFLGTSVVEAKEKEVEFSNSIGTVQLLDAGSDCDALFGDPDKSGSLAYYLQKILDVIKYAGIVLCIVLTIVDFGKALLADDKDLFKPLSKTAFTRMIYAVFLFFLPAIVKTLLLLIDVYGTCGLT